jgi:AAA domain
VSDTISQEEWDRRQAAGAWAQPPADEPDSAPPPIKLTPASTVVIDRTRWVWENRIPIGGTTLMPGREGLGKTALVCHLGARLSRGDLPGERFGRPGDI